MFASACIVFLIIGAAFGGGDMRAKLRFYHDSFENYTELPIDEAKNILSSTWYNSSRTTIIFCHGFTGHPKSPEVIAIINAYLEQGQSNVALLNWDQLAASKYILFSTSYLMWAVPNAIKLGADFANILLPLSEAGLDLNKTHLVGHSLGAQIFGITGNKMVEKGVRLPWITGLDPAGPVFDFKWPHERLNPNSAGFVDVIHSDPSKYGSKIQLGTVDFWPNYRIIGPVLQPGCDNRWHPMFSSGDLCNHQKCWQYLIDSMKYPESVLGSHANNFWEWENYEEPEQFAVVLELGKYYHNAVPGNYYFLTAASSPHGLAVNGL